MPIPNRVFTELTALLALNPFRDDPDPWVFYSAEPTRPVGQSYATRALHRALEVTGVDEVDRTRRVLNFHAWRHTFNSLLISHRVPMQMVQSVTGHLTDEMTQRYIHASSDAMREIRDILDGIVQSLPSQ